VLWETVPCRRSCVGKASLSELDACSWRLIFAGTGGAQTSTGLQICCSSDFISKVGWCSFCVYFVHE